MYHLACASSSDLLLTELLLYNIGIPIERAFGSVKYAVSISIVHQTSSHLLTITQLAVLLRHLRCDDHSSLLPRASCRTDHICHEVAVQQYSTWADRDYVRTCLPVYAARAPGIPLPRFRGGHE